MYIYVRLHVLALDWFVETENPVCDLWFPDLEPFLFHFQPQGAHAGVLITENTGEKEVWMHVWGGVTPLLSHAVSFPAHWRAVKVKHGYWSKRFNISLSSQALLFITVRENKVLWCLVNPSNYRPISLFNGWCSRLAARSSWVQFQLWPSLRGVCMFSMYLHSFSLGTSFHSPKKSKLGQSVIKKFL